MKQYPFGKNLKHIRKCLGYRQRDIAFAANTNVSSICTYEKGGEATLSVVIRIARAFGVTIDDLVFKDLTVEKITVTFNNVQFKLNQDETLTETEPIVNSPISSWAERRKNRKYSKD
jgi:transcriptional regulator with XRE-family HTH domain